MGNDMGNLSLLPLKLDEANRICEQWRQWTVATRAENEALRARVKK